MSKFLVTSPEVMGKSGSVRAVACGRLHRLSCVNTDILRRSTVFPMEETKVPVGVHGAGTPRSGKALVMRTAYYRPGCAVAKVTKASKFTTVAVRGTVVGSRINFYHGMLRMFRSGNISVRRVPSKVSAVAVFIRGSTFRRGRRRVLTNVRGTMSPSRVRLRSSLTLVTVINHKVGSAENATKEVFSTLTRTRVGIGVVSRKSDRLGVVINMHRSSFGGTVGTLCRVFMLARVWGRRELGESRCLVFSRARRQNHFCL